MTDRLKKYWEKFEPTLPFLVIVWTIGFYCLRQGAKQFNLDSPDKIHPMHLLFVFIGFFFILLPFIKTIEIGKYIKLERYIKETKDEVKDFKNEIRQSVQLLSTSVTASIGNLNNQVTINIPGAEELRQEIEKLKLQSKEKDGAKLETIKDELLLDEDEDMVMALARTRIKIESLLRKALNKRQSISNNKKTDIKFLGLQSLYTQYVEQDQDFNQFYNSFRYVQSICNAAIHGQRISRGQADEALQLGAIIIRELNSKIDNK